MKKQLFEEPLTMKEIKESSCFGSKIPSPNYAHIIGYYEAGKILAEQVIKAKNSSKKDTLIYPLCSNYRHYIEIHLKSMIEESEILYSHMETLGYIKNGLLPEKVSDKLNNTHDLYKLLGYIEERIHFTSISNEEFPKDISKYIKQMHDMDKDGQKYRYSKSKDGKPHFPDEERYNVKNIMNVMQEVNDMLWAIDSHISYYIDMSNNIISYYEDEMRSNCH